jgi:hypothetical protein
VFGVVLAAPADAQVVATATCEDEETCEVPSEGLGLTTLESPATLATFAATELGRVAELANWATSAPPAVRTVSTGASKARAMAVVLPLTCKRTWLALRSSTFSPKLLR